eukprot:1160426-Pelagomonas_calceolata.AAC.3
MGWERGDMWKGNRNAKDCCNQDKTNNPFQETTCKAWQPDPAKLLKANTGLLSLQASSAAYVEGVVLVKAEVAVEMEARLQG